jgi:hypothetical protein
VTTYKKVLVRELRLLSWLRFDGVSERKASLVRWSDLTELSEVDYDTTLDLHLSARKQMLQRSTCHNRLDGVFIFLSTDGIYSKR